MPWIKKELEKLGYEVHVPTMPEAKYPEKEAWLSYLSQEIGQPRENDVLVGHSLGCITIIRYLETLAENERVGRVVFVAGFTDDLNVPEIKSFFETPVNFGKIQQKAKGFIAIHSDNDRYVSLKYGILFKKKLGAEIIIRHNAGHFTGPVDDQSKASLEIIIKSIIKPIG